MSAFHTRLSKFLRQAAIAFSSHGSTMASHLSEILANNHPCPVPAAVTLPAHVALALDHDEDASALPALTSALRDVAAELPWRRRLARPRDDAMEERYAIVSLLEPGGLIDCPDCRFGLFALAPQTHYPPHSHAAEELYLVLSGTAGWRKKDGPFAPVTPGSFVHHLSWESHAMKTGDAPLLALWAWSGNIDPGTYRMDN
jgi:dimethylpropiothetin dethiomethylase